MNPALLKLIDKLVCDNLTADPWKHITAYIAVDAAADAAICEAKARVLKSALAWGGEGQALASQALETTRALAQAGAALSERLEAAREDDEQDERLQNVILIALANHGSAIRWSAMVRGARGEPPYAAIHSLYARAERLGLALARARIVRDAKPRMLNAESHYLRTLLMPLACHESLDPQQLEIVDDWLWGWVDEYRLTRQVEGDEPRLWVDIEGATGVSLRQLMPEGRDVRHLVVAKMDDHVRAAIESFHAGRVPGLGCSTSFPIEAHSGVLDHVQVLWDQIRNGAPKRRFERLRRIEPLRVDGLVGLPAVLGAADARARAARHPMYVRDESAGGAGIIVDRSLWDQIWHGDLVGIHAEPGQPPRVGYVVRKFPIEGSGFAIGIEWLALAPRLLALRDGKAAQPVPALYIADEDESGRFDTVILDDSRFLANTRYELELDDRVFEIRLNRVMRRGRGWVSAGYEITGVRRAGLAA